jgi:hypothetical protein
MPAGAKGKNVYQGSLVVQQALAVKSGGVDHAGGEPSSSSRSDIVTGGIGDAPTMGEDLPVVEWEKDDDAAPPTLPPPTPSPSKRRFSALSSEGADSSSASTIPGPSSAGISGISPVSRSTASSSSKRGRITGAIAISSLRQEVSDIKGLLRMDIELTKSNAEAREERKRLERESLEERERLERERLEHEKDPMLDAICRMEEVDTDLPPDDQAILADLFNNRDSAKTYLTFKSDPVRKAWINFKVAQARSSTSGRKLAESG